MKRDPLSLIKIAVDSVELLNRTHIFCVLDHCNSDEIQSAADFIAQERPDLLSEVGRCLGQICKERQLLATQPEWLPQSISCQSCATMQPGICYDLSS